jgi:hypothetical protein
MEARNREGIGLSYRPARLHRLAESILGLLKFKNSGSVEICKKKAEKGGGLIQINEYWDKVVYVLFWRSRDK